MNPILSSLKTYPGVLFKTLLSNDLKIFLVVLLIVINLLLLTSFGMSDMVAWCFYAKGTVGRDIFAAHISVYQLYPLLATVIFSMFYNGLRFIAGPEAECFLGIKASIFIFYVLTAILFYIFWKITKKKTVNKLDFLLVFLSAFSLIVNTQGLGYVDIYTIPATLASFIFLYKKRYFLSGLLMGISVSIKFEPILLIPLFGLTIFDLKQPFKKILGNIIRFILGLIPLTALLWVLLWIYPDSHVAIFNQLNVLFKAPYLSGQGLNLNWIVTYLLHIFQPETYSSLTSLKGINYYIKGDNIFWPRHLFYLISGFIMLRYWLFQKKNFTNFLTASAMVYFTHFIINREVHEQHLLYTVVLALALYLYNRSPENLNFLILVDLMNLVNMILFYGFTGSSFFTRVFLGVDITIIFAVYYVSVYFWILRHYFKSGTL